jgi:hypothetical protein
MCNLKVKSKLTPRAALHPNRVTMSVDLFFGSLPDILRNVHWQRQLRAELEVGNISYNDYQRTVHLLPSIAILRTYTVTGSFLLLPVSLLHSQFSSK